jgi:EAL domain-containing protein (putative c-di-GMP-specific phosphodiesterase class I)
MSDRTFRLTPSDIDQAFERNEFRVVFQPKVDLTTQQVTGAESFIRWLHPTYGLLPPGLFLEFIEAQGRMGELTGYVFHESLKAAARWRSMGRDWTVSVNVGPRDLVSEGFASGLAELIAEYRLKPEHVIIEVPERALAQDPEALGQALVAVRQTGVHVALDGGGIVPVDLSQFSPMPFTSVKVGGTATIRLAQRLGLKGAGAVAARLRFARQYGLEAVAVGAEDEAMMKGLAFVGFTAAQGIWVQKPMPLDDLMAWDGTWARGNGAIDIASATVEPEARPAVARAPASAAVAHAASVKPPGSNTPADDKAVSKEDMQRALEAVRARRHAGAAAAEAKAAAPVVRKTPVKAQMPAVDLSELEDVVEDEETSAPPPAFGQQKGGGSAGEACPPMKSLVERRRPKADGPAPTPRRASAQDGVA